MHTSPRGTHLGHYKVWLKEYPEKGYTEKEEGPILSGTAYFKLLALKLNLTIQLYIIVSIA